MHDALQAGQFFRPEVLAGYPGTAFIPGQHFHRQLNIGGGQRLLPDWTNLDSLYGVMVNDDLFSRIPDVRTHQMDNRSNHTFYLEASVA